MTHKNDKLFEDYDKKSLFDIEICIRRNEKTEINEYSVIYIYRYSHM